VSKSGDPGLHRGAAAAGRRAARPERINVSSPGSRHTPGPTGTPRMKNPAALQRAGRTDPL